MKNILSIAILSVLFVACGGDPASVDGIIAEGNVDAMRAMKNELTTQQNTIKEDIAKLTEEIQKHEKGGPASLVTTKTVKDTTFKHYIEVQGNVDTDENIIIYPEYSGVLTSVYVEEGQRVSKGQRLAKIDEGGLGSQLAQLEAQAALAKTTYERQKRLWDQKIGSEIQYLEAKTNYDATQASVNQMKSQLAKTVITAPFSGVVDDIIAEQGGVVNPGQTPVIRLVNLSEMYVDAAIPETYLSKVNKGTDVIVELSSLGKSYEGQIRQVGNFVNPDNRTFNVKVAIPNPDNAVKPNLIATVKINDYTAENAIVVPQNVLQQNSSGENIAYIYEKQNDTTGVAKQVKIETGLTQGETIEIKSGIEKGEILIIDGARALRDGQKIRANSTDND
ncbi:MAG: efflux transporter periplasmic adaptor subunit [Cytophagaceae bacterium]|nr:efflux transporter periplasmic adaptor subunit [Cytophagaceae bacterium]|tara:strand:- start:47075 stop:48247 length:1173 start_codon:yes stop_codon:yes gene_type:complete